MLEGLFSALVELIVAVIGFILELTGLLITIIIDICKALFNKQERKKFIKSWHDSHLYKFGVFLHLILMVLIIIFIFPFWSIVFTSTTSPEEKEIIFEKPAEEKKEGLTFSYTSKGNTKSIKISNETANKIWESAKKLLSNKNEKPENEPSDK